MNGHNDISSAMSLAALRAEYQSNFFPDQTASKPDPAIKDLNLAEMRFYGKIDQSGRPIIPKDSEMVMMMQNSQQEAAGQHLVLPFVKSIHDDMRQNLMIKATLGNILMSDKSFVTLEPVQAYLSPLNMYNTYIKNLFASFNQLFLSERDKNNITSFSKYVNYLFRYFNELEAGQPITLSGWVTSDHNSLYTTGLCFSIKENEYHDDRTNFDFGFNPLFDYYKKLAMNKGFCLVKQAPWILIADLNSPAIKPMYISGMESANDVINTYYDKASDYDITLIKNNIINYYNDFVLLNENRRTIDVTCSNKTMINYDKREYLSPQSKFNNDRAYLRMYCHLRNIELKNPLPPSDLKDLVRNAKKKFDMNSAMSYIEDIFASLLFRKPFGFNHLRQREILRMQGKKGIGITKEQAETQTFTSDSMSGGGMATGGGGSGGGY